MLRIGIVTDGLEERVVGDEVEIANGGVGVYIYNLVKQLLEIDDRNEYFLVRCGRGRLDVYANGRARHVPLDSGTFTRYARWVDVPYRRLARDLRLDLIHYPNQFGGGFLPRRVRRVVTLHDLTPLLLPRCHPWRSVIGFRLLLRRALARADCVIVDSEATARDLVAGGYARPEKLRAIPLAPSPIFDRISGDARPAEGFARRYDLPERFILTVGVLEPRKNHGILFEALARLHAEGAEVGLVIVGRDGWRWRDLTESPGFARLRPHVRIFRNVPDRDLAELYRRAEVFAYPSLYEGFGLPVVEAMTSGTPVVTSRVSSLPEVAGDAALYADPRDAGSFAVQCLRCLRDPELRAKLSEAGRRQVQALSWRRTAEETLAVYERVCRGG